MIFIYNSIVNHIQQWRFISEKNNDDKNNYGEDKDYDDKDVFFIIKTIIAGVVTMIA